MNTRTSLLVVAIIMIAGTLLYSRGIQAPVLRTSEAPQGNTGSGENLSASVESAKKEENKRTRASASGMVSARDGIYVLTGDPNFTHGLTVRNSGNAKVSAILELFIGKKVSLSGIVESRLPDQMIVLSIDNREVVTEAEAMDSGMMEEENIGGESFADFYAELTSSQKTCIRNALGASKVDQFLASSATKPSKADLEKMAVCVQ